MGAGLSKAGRICRLVSCDSVVLLGTWCFTGEPSIPDRDSALPCRTEPFLLCCGQICRAQGSSRHVGVAPRPCRSPAAAVPGLLSRVGAGLQTSAPGQRPPRRAAPASRASAGERVRGGSAGPRVLPPNPRAPAQKIERLPPLRCEGTRPGRREPQLRLQWCLPRTAAASCPRPLARPAVGLGVRRGQIRVATLPCGVAWGSGGTRALWATALDLERLPCRSQPRAAPPRVLRA